MNPFARWLFHGGDTWLDHTLVALGVCAAVTILMTVLALAWVGLLQIIA